MFSVTSETAANLSVQNAPARSARADQTPAPDSFSALIDSNAADTAGNDRTAPTAPDRPSQRPDEPSATSDGRPAARRRIFFESRRKDPFAGRGTQRRAARCRRLERRCRRGLQAGKTRVCENRHRESSRQGRGFGHRHRNRLNHISRSCCVSAGRRRDERNTGRGGRRDCGPRRSDGYRCRAGIAGQAQRNRWRLPRRRLPPARRQLRRRNRSQRRYKARAIRPKPASAPATPAATPAEATPTSRNASRSDHGCRRSGCGCGRQTHRRLQLTQSPPPVSQPAAKADAVVGGQSRIGSGCRRGDAGRGCRAKGNAQDDHRRAAKRKRCIDQDRHSAARGRSFRAIDITGRRQQERCAARPGRGRQTENRRRRR